MTETETETEFIHNILKPGVKIEERVDGHLQTNADPTMRPHFQIFRHSEIGKDRHIQSGHHFPGSFGRTNHSRFKMQKRRCKTFYVEDISSQQWIARKFTTNATFLFVVDFFLEISNHFFLFRYWCESNTLFVCFGVLSSKNMPHPCNSEIRSRAAYLGKSDPLFPLCFIVR